MHVTAAVLFNTPSVACNRRYASGTRAARVRIDANRAFAARLRGVPSACVVYPLLATAWPPLGELFRSMGINKSTPLFCVFFILVSNAKWDFNHLKGDSVVP
jgi:hypothetical protein